MKIGLLFIALMAAGMLWVIRRVSKQRRQDIDRLPDDDPPE